MRPCGWRTQGVAHARLVQYAIVLDRLFRFPITGDRVRNYDGLGGQLLFAYLHQHDVLRWTDNRLSIDWERLPERRDRPAAPRSRRSTGAASTAPKRGALARGVRAGLALRRPAPGSTWAKGSAGAAAGRAAQGADRRGAAGRVPAQHVLRGAAQEARRRHRRHHRDHRREHGGRRWPARSPAGSSWWPARPAPPGPPLVARLAAAGATVVAADASAERLEPVVAQGNAAAADGGNVHAAVVDLLDEQATRDWAAAVLAEFGRVDGLVHLVGGWRGGEPSPSPTWPTGRCCRTCWSARCSTPRAPSTTA